MNKNIFFFGLVLVMLCCSCNKDVKQFTGDYSYKIAGEVAVLNEDGEVSYHLIHKIGQMNILKDNTTGSRDKVIVTMNEMNGSAYTISATVHDDVIEFDPYEFNTNILTAESGSILSQDNNSLVYRVSASGKGRLNGDMLMIEESWSGYQCGNQNITLKGPQITILAERN